MAEIVQVQEGPLSAAEARELSRCEGVLRQSLRQALEVGQALRDIRDRRLYRQTHRSFEGYCQDRWALSRRRAYQLIDAAVVAENVNPGTQDEEGIRTERQARVLASLEPDEQREVWQAAVAAGDTSVAGLERARDELYAPEAADGDGDAELDALDAEAFAALSPEKKRAVIEAEERELLEARRREEERDARDTAARQVGGDNTAERKAAVLRHCAALRKLHAGLTDAADRLDELLGAYEAEVQASQG